MSPLKYFVTAVAWYWGVYSVAQTLLKDNRNIIGIQAAVRLYGLLTP